MSNRRLVKDHLLVRWLERAEGFDMRMVRSAMARDGIIGGNDSDVVHFIGLHLGFDIDALREELATVIRPAVAMGAWRVKYRGMAICLRGAGGVTALYTRRPRAKSLDFGEMAKRRRREKA